jgi:hypothetical protein
MTRRYQQLLGVQATVPRPCSLGALAASCVDVQAPHASPTPRHPHASPTPHHPSRTRYFSLVRTSTGHENDHLTPTHARK